MTNTARRTHGFRESVIREMTRLAQRARRDQPRAGLPRLPDARRAEGRGRRAPSTTTSTSTPSPGARQRLRDALARKYARWYGMEVDPEREITVTCGATEAMIADPPRGGRSGRRGHRLRAVLRELRARRDPRRRARRSSSRSEPGRPLDLDRLARRVLVADPRHHRQHAAQSRRARLHASRARGDRATLCVEHDVLGGHRRDLRAHPLRRRAHPDRHAAGHARADGHDLRRVQDVQRHRLAGGLDHRAGRASPTRSGRCTTSSPSARRRRCRRRVAVALDSWAGRTTPASRRAIGRGATC